MRGTGKFFYFAFAARYGTATGYPTSTPHEYWLPAIQKRGVVGESLFQTQTGSLRQALANVERIAAETGRTPSQVVEDLKADRDAEGAREARRFAVSAPFVEIGGRGS